MTNILQNSVAYVSNRSKCIPGLIFVLGMGVILIYSRNSLYPKSVGFINFTVNKIKPFNLALNIGFDSTLPNLCIVTRIYGAQMSYFPVLALGLYHTGLNNIRVYVINTENRTDIQQLKQTINFINELVLRQDYVSFLDLGEPPIKQDYGYEMSDRALSYLYRQNVHSPSICQYVTFTNGDNFYSRNFARKILPHMRAEKDVIGWGFVSHHFKPHYRENIDSTKKTVPLVVDDGTEKCTPVELRNACADLGAVAYRLSFLQKHDRYFRDQAGNYGGGSDGYFVDRAAERTNASIILKQTLFVHQ